MFYELLNVLYYNMETLALLGLAYAGFNLESMSNKQQDKEYNKNHESMVYDEKNVYSNNKTKEIKKEIEQKAENMFEDMRYGEKNNNLSSNSHDEYFMYKNMDDMTLGVEVDTTTHNNMKPFTSRKDTSLFLDRDNRRLEATSGNDIYWKKKQEVPNLFKPMKDLTHVNGMPNYTQMTMNRYIPTTKKQDQELPNSRKHVAPGLNGKTQKGLYNTERILPRDISQTRSKINQKNTYKGRIISSGVKGKARQSDINMTKFKKPDFVEQSNDDIKAMPKANQTERKAMYGEILMPNTHRQDSVSYAGVAALKTVGGGNNIEKTDFTESNKSTFNTGVTNLSHQTQYLFNRESIQNNPTNRALTSQQIVGNASNSNNLAYIRNDDLAKTTIKETTNFSHTGNVSNNNNIAYIRNDDIAKPTIKQTTNFSHTGNVSNENNMTYIRNNDIAKPTIKETTNFSHTGNVSNENNMTYIRNNDIAKPTIKETTNFSHTGNVSNENNMTYIRNNDIAKPTIKETTNFSHTGNVSNENNMTYIRNNDVAKTTIKETTQFSHTGNVSNENNMTYIRNDDIAKPTIKETTQFSHTGNAATETNTYVRNDDDARTTIKETTLITNHKGGISNHIASSRRQEAERSMNIDDRRNITDLNRMTNGGKDMSGPNRSTIGTYRNVKEESEYNHMGGGLLVKNENCVPMSYTRFSRRFNERSNINEFREDTLKDNPYIIKY